MLVINPPWDFIAKTGAYIPIPTATINTLLESIMFEIKEYSALKLIMLMIKE